MLAIRIVQNEIRSLVASLERAACLAAGDELGGGAVHGFELLR
jgi:hypothetical protein